MVEDVKHLEAHVERHAFGNFRIFFHTQIRAYPSRSGEQELLCASSHAAGFVIIWLGVAITVWETKSEGRRVEVLAFCRIMRIQLLD